MTDPVAGAPDPTRVDRGEEPSTVDAPARWSGSAAVPPPREKRAWWSRRRPEQDHTDWATIPAVDPWEGQDTPVDPFPPVPEMPETHLPPTRLEPPPQSPAAAPPPTPAQPAPAPPAPAPPAPAPPAPPKISKRARKRAARELEAARARMAEQRRPPVGPVPVRPPGGQVRPGLPAPPPWAPRAPQRPLPPAPRKRRRWGRRFALLSVLGLVCCCGGPIAYFQVPAARQHPVTASLPETFSDLTRRDDNASRRAAERLAEELRAADAGSDGAFAGVYGDRRGKRVTLFGVTGFRFNPGRDARAQLERVAADVKLSGMRKFDLGEFGAHEFCGVGRVDGNTMVICSWADHGSMATVLLTRRSLADSAELVGRLRGAVLSPG